MERAPPRSGGAPGLVGGGVNAPAGGGVTPLELALIASIWPETVFYTSTSKLFNPTRFSFFASRRGAHSIVDDGRAYGFVSSRRGHAQC